MSRRKKRVLVAAVAVIAAIGGLLWLLVLRRIPADPALRTHPIRAPILPALFPAGFRFGFATVAYQSEGTLRADGSRVASNWSEWEDLGRVKGAERNDRGNGFFDGYEADLDRAAALGATSFSYAIDWARLEPAAGVFDETEVARVVAIVRAMRARGLRPLIVLFHWVTPSWVQSPKTGVDLLARDDRAFVDAFLPLLDKVVPPLAPLVDDWVTFEEPWSIVGAEYLDGEHPPGRRFDLAAAKRALVNLMYLHARTYRRVHELDTADADGDGVAASVGFETIAIDVEPLRPASPEDVSATARVDYIVNHHFLRGIWEGEVDADLDGEHVTRVPELERTLDFIGVNYYQRMRVEGGRLFGLIPAVHALPHVDVREYDAGAPHSDMYQEIAPEGLRRVIEGLARYGLPLYVTENGLGDDRDDRRPCYTLEHLYTVARAIADGYDVRGYYAWTISDNFEWDQGTDARFGLFRVDFGAPGFPRTRNRSADLFEAVARAHAIDRATWDRFTLPEYPVGRE